MIEEWRDIEGYEGLYQVSNLGRVKSLDKYVKRRYAFVLLPGRIISFTKDTKGYQMARLYKDGKVKCPKVHRLVARAFIPNPNNFPQVNHKDEDKNNNRIDNLEWCTNDYNRNYGTRNERAIQKMIGKFVNNPDRSKSVLCIETGEIFPSIMEVQRKYGINNSHIVQCCKGKEETCGGYHWKYAS